MTGVPIQLSGDTNLRTLKVWFSRGTVRFGSAMSFINRLASDLLLYLFHRELIIYNFREDVLGFLSKKVISDLV